MLPHSSFCGRLAMSQVNVTQKSYRDKELRKASKMDIVDTALQPSADGTQMSDERIRQFSTEIQKKTDQKEDGTQIDLVPGDGNIATILRMKQLGKTQKESRKVSALKGPSKGGSKMRPKQPSRVNNLTRRTTTNTKSVGSVLKQPATDGGGDEDEDADDSYSEDIMVFQTDENEAYLNRVIIGKLSLLGLRRTLWNSKLESFFVIFCFLLSYDSLSSFAVEFDNHGPIFIAYYLLFVFIVAIPTMYMEISLGQYTSSTVCVVFDRMVPALMGIGLTCLAYNFLTAIADQMIMPVFAKLFLHSLRIFESQLTFQHCSNEFNTVECRSLMNPTCEELNQQLEARSEVEPMYREDAGLRYVAYGDLCVQSRLSPVYMDENEPLDLEDPLGVWMGAVSHNQFSNSLFNHCFSWFLVYFVCQQKENIVKFQKVTIFLVLSVLMTLLVAILYFNPPMYPFLDSFTNEKDVNHFQAIISAAILVTKVFKLGQGGFVYFGAQSHIHNRILPDCFIIAAVMTVFPILYSTLHLLICDSFTLGAFKGDRDRWLGSIESALDDSVYSSGNQIVQFSVFAVALSTLGSYEGFIMAIITFASILLLMICHVEIIVSSIVEFFFEQEDHSRVLNVVVFAGALGTFMFQGPLGFDILVGTDNLLLPLLGIFILLSELLALNFYGRKRFFANLMFICNRRNPKDSWLLVKQWTVFVLGFLLFVGILLSAVIQLIGFVLEYRKSPNEMVSFVAVLFVFIGGIIPAIAYLRINDRMAKSGDVHGLFSPNRDLWGPRSRADRNVAEMVERELVKTSTFHRKMGNKE